MGSGSFVFFFVGIRDQPVPSCLWDQRPKFVTLLELRIRNFGTKMGLALKTRPHQEAILTNLFLSRKFQSSAMVKGGGGGGGEGLGPRNDVLTTCKAVR